MAGLQLGILGVSDGRDVALILLAFVFPLQLVASVFGYLARDVVAGTAMGLLSGIWLSIALVKLTSVPGSSSDALGLFLLLGAAAMLVPAAAAASGKLVPVLVLGTTSLRFALTGFDELTTGAFWQDAAGVTGLALCVIAVYAGAAMAFEDAQRRTVLPLGRRGPGRESMEGNVQDQLARIEHEAGVREQL